MKIIWIRHTRVGVPKGTCYGWSDVPLAETFPQEAVVTKENLEKWSQENGSPRPVFDAVYSSPLTRARKLAAFCGYSSKDFPAPVGEERGNAILDDRLKEMNMGDWEMRLYDDIAKTDPHILKWFRDYMHLACTGGESFPEMYARVSHFIDELRQKPFRRVAVFAHGGVLISAGIYGGLCPKEKAFEHLTDYGGLEEIEI